MTDTEGCPAIARRTPLGSRCYLLLTQLSWMVQTQCCADSFLLSSREVLICRIGAWPGKYSVVGVGPVGAPLVTGAAVSVTVVPLIERIVSPAGSTRWIPGQPARPNQLQPWTVPPPKG